MLARFSRSALAALAVLALAHAGSADTSPRPDRQRGTSTRGAWTASSFERWRGAIENYVSSVKLGNQTQIGAAAVAYATYLNEMHLRIHPLFADWFLVSLDSLPPSNPINDPHLVTTVEIVLARDGHIAKMGIVKRSGVTSFDIGALDAVDRASPFGPPPAAILSSDGQVYIRWELHRDDIACSTANVRPYILNLAAPRDARLELTAAQINHGSVLFSPAN